MSAHGITTILEYFNVTRQLDQRTNVQVTIPEGPGMANLRKEMDWRRLGNGYCTRPTAG